MNEADLPSGLAEVNESEECERNQFGQSGSGMAQDGSNRSAKAGVEVDLERHRQVRALQPVQCDADPGTAT